jgi:hypothetical protein
MALVEGMYLEHPSGSRFHWDDSRGVWTPVPTDDDDPTTAIPYETMTQLVHGTEA